MGKFDAFGTYLSKQSAATITMSFSEVEKIIGTKLCKSAYTYDAYWHPTEHHPFANVISDSGYKVDKVDLVNKIVTLIRE